jgi:RNA polymerase subunit RPABC4/transcription elongation factor Spt4
MDDEELEGQLIDLAAQIENLNKVMTEANVQAEPYLPAAPTAEDFTQTVAEIRKRDNCTRTAALAKARSENQAGFAAYCAGPADNDFAALVEEEISKGSPASVAAQRVALRYPELAKATRCKSCGAYAASDQSTCPNCDAPLAKGVSDFMAAVDATMIEKKLSRTAAMSEVRKSCPELFARYQEV